MNGPEAIAAFMFFGGTFWVLRPVAAAVAKRIAGEHRRPGMEPADRDEILSELDITVDEGYIARIRENLGESLANRYIDYTRIREMADRQHRILASPDHQDRSAIPRGLRHPVVAQSPLHAEDAEGQR